MKKINLLYWVLPLALYGAWSVFQYFGKNAHSFFGFAENEETQINLDHDVMVSHLYVVAGQSVKKGDLLLDVVKPEFEFRLSELAQEISGLESEDQLRRAEITSELRRLRAVRAEKISEVRSNLRLAEAELQLNEWLIKDLKTVSAKDAPNIDQQKIEALREEAAMVVQPIDAEIQKLEKELLLVSAPTQAQVSKLKTEMTALRTEQQRLTIKAPSDGLVGNVLCREGENISSFNTLISFYEKTPKQVVAYVHESLILKIKTGDSLLVTSSLHPDEQCKGKVVGMGHRIIEIPERLRKIPEIKTYGREVLIEIPAENNFLQKEKVILQPLNGGEPF